MTLDGAYMEQMSRIVRFLEIQRHHVEIKINISDLVWLDWETAEVMSMNITKKLEQDRLNLKTAGVSPMKIKSSVLR